MVVAGGSGTRFGGAKQLAVLGGLRVVDRSIEALRPWVNGIVVVGNDDIGTPKSLSVDAVVGGGPSRSTSVRAGLKAVPDSATHVLVHDAVRPLVPAEVVGRVIEQLTGGAEAVVPVVPVTDSLRLVSGGTVDRSGLVAVQTPQGFELMALRSAHDLAVEGTDDASVVEAIGVAVVHVDGSPINLKVTFPHDLVIAERILAGAISEESMTAVEPAEDSESVAR